LLAEEAYWWFSSHQDQNSICANLSLAQKYSPDKVILRGQISYSDSVYAVLDMAHALVSIVLMSADTIVDQVFVVADDQLVDKFQVQPRC
jgi:hypothetical protein